MLIFKNPRMILELHMTKDLKEFMFLIILTMHVFRLLKTGSINSFEMSSKD